MKHDFEAAHQFFCPPEGQVRTNQTVDALEAHMAASNEALRIMAEVQKGKLAVVPVEPTDDMYAAGQDAFNAPLGQAPANTRVINGMRMNNAYKAMLSAAPKVGDA